VLDLIPAPLWRADYAPVGRLDKDTTGLLWMTTDGELVHRLTHPRWKVPKRYVATLRDAATPDDIRAFSVGEITLDGEPVLPAMLDVGPDPRVVGVTLREGRYHQE
jgi:16S rRNA pseudouridine516 synthase